MRINRKAHGAYELSMYGSSCKRTCLFFGQPAGFRGRWSQATDHWTVIKAYSLRFARQPSLHHLKTLEADSKLLP